MIVRAQPPILVTAPAGPPSPAVVLKREWREHGCRIAPGGHRQSGLLSGEPPPLHLDRKLGGQPWGACARAPRHERYHSLRTTPPYMYQYDKSYPHTQYRQICVLDALEIDRKPSIRDCITSTNLFTRTMPPTLPIEHYTIRTLRI